VPQPARLAIPLTTSLPTSTSLKPITAGQVLINNILCAAWTVTYNDAGTPRKIQVVFFDRKWFITDQGDTITRTASAVIAGNILLYGTTGSNLIKFYNSATATLEWRIATALWPMGDPIRDKQALKLGVEATLATGFASFDAFIDSENQQSPAIPFANSVEWINNLRLIQLHGRIAVVPRLAGHLFLSPAATNITYTEAMQGCMVSILVSR
jgi:hypothetical protein